MDGGGELWEVDLESESWRSSRAQLFDAFVVNFSYRKIGTWSLCQLHWASFFLFCARNQKAFQEQQLTDEHSGKHFYFVIIKILAVSRGFISDLCRSCSSGFSWQAAQWWSVSTCFPFSAKLLLLCVNSVGSLLRCWLSLIKNNPNNSTSETAPGEKVFHALPNLEDGRSAVKSKKTPSWRALAQYNIHAQMSLSE